MCGIVGVVTCKGGQLMPSILDAAVDSMQNRGPDDRGIVSLSDKATGTQGIFGHRRLSILDISPAGHQPMSYRDGALTIVYNGEIYNFHEIRRELETYGYTFKSNSDTEVILAAYDKWGTDFVRRCNGIFAMAIWDSRNRRLFLCRDHIGIKPLYYGFQNGSFYFASTLSAIANVRGFEKKVDEDALLTYVWLGYVPAPFSMFKGINKLLPGHFAILNFGAWELNIEPYWQLADKVPSDDRPAKSMDDTLSELEALLEDSVRMQLVSDVPIGAFLSGGIDSSTVVALMKKINAGPVKTFSIGFDVERFNEAPMAKAIAEHLGTDHHEWILTVDDIKRAIPEVSKFHDEPFSDSSCMPTMLLSQLTRNEVTVALSGDGGDELFYGDYHHYKIAEYWKYISWMPRWLRKILGKSMHFDFLSGKKRSIDLIQSINFAHFQYNAQAIWTVSSYPNIFRDYNSSSLERLVRRLPAFDACKAIEGKPIKARRKASIHDFSSLLPDDLLVKVDRASMAHALEVRVPLLDYRVAELAVSIPEKIGFYQRRYKYLLKRILGKHVPMALWERPKKGFAVPLEVWFRTDLYEYMRTRVLDAGGSFADYFNRAELEKIIADHKSGALNNYRILWGLLNLMQWGENNAI